MFLHVLITKATMDRYCKIINPVNFPQISKEVYANSKHVLPWERHKVLQKSYDIRLFIRSSKIFIYPFGKKDL